jgi:hypothetical protein
MNNEKIYVGVDYAKNNKTSVFMRKKSNGVMEVFDEKVEKMEENKSFNDYIIEINGLSGLKFHDTTTSTRDWYKQFNNAELKFKCDGSYTVGLKDCKKETAKDQRMKLIEEVKLEEAKKQMKTEKMLNISLIPNAVLSLSVILLSITVFAIMVYGTIGIYD